MNRPESRSLAAATATGQGAAGEKAPGRGSPGRMAPGDGRAEAMAARPGPSREMAPGRRPRLGFMGLGWIGRLRLESLLRARAGEVCAVLEPDGPCREAALALAPGARVPSTQEQLLEEPLDGIVIATPSALHAAQARAALEAGHAVFCQKPLGRTAAETAGVVDSARRADRLLGVDLSYRYMQGTSLARDLIDSGELGEVYAADLVFHNAYGPDKPWFYDPRLAGGGCLMDLGIHLVDLALWLFEGRRPVDVHGRLFRQGRALKPGESVVEDFASVHFDMEGGPHVRLACSWGLPAGRDAVIEASFYGTRGGVCIRNLNGSLFDFETWRFRGTAAERLRAPPDDWGGRALIAWAQNLSRGARFDPEAERWVGAAEVLDAVYGRR